MEEITPADGSLDHAASQFASLLSGSPSPEDKSAGASQPEQPSASPAPTTEQAPAAPDPTSESEQAEHTETETEQTDDTPQQPQTFKAIVNGQEVQVTLEEALKGYSRTQDYTRKTQELAEQRRKFEAEELSAVRAERQQYQQTLGDLKKTIEAATPKEPDWQQLRQSAHPEVFAAAWAEWDQRTKQLASIEAEQRRVEALQSQEAEKGFRAYVQAEQAKLAEAIPDFRDASKAAALKKDLSEFAKSRGFTEDELGQVTDHRLVLLLHEALQAQKAKTKAPEIKNKIERVLESPPPGPKSSSPKSDASKEAMAQLRKTGRPEDAARVFSELFK